MKTPGSRIPLTLFLSLAGVLVIGIISYRPAERIFDSRHLTPTPGAALAAPTETPAPTDAPTPTWTALAPATGSPTAGEAITPVPDLPEEHYIEGIRGHHQYFALGCETAAAKDWANYFGKDFNEFEFQYKLPSSDNPEYGFVGSVDSEWGQVPPYAYGVYPGPIADLLNAYDIPAKAHGDYTLEQVREQIAQDKPVIAWVIGNVVGGIPAEYTDSQGRKTTVAAFEHVVIVTGYGPGTIRYMNNGKFFDTPEEVFLNSWGVLGNRVVAVD